MCGIVSEFKKEYVFCPVLPQNPWNSEMTTEPTSLAPLRMTSAADLCPVVRARRREQSLRIDDAASLSGVSVDLLSRLEGDEWVPLDVELHPPGERPIRLRAEIAWVQPDQGGDGGLDRVGARFDAVGPEDMARLQGFLETERRRTFRADTAQSA